MKCRTLLMATALVAAASTMALAQSDVHQPTKDDKGKAPAGQPQPPLPPGWTMEDMQACEAAATPGKEHERLAKGAGTWQGKGTMWMGPGMEGQPVECTTVITPMFEGRFVKTEITGDMPGMGPFNGFGINGFDNVSKKYFSTWIDNCGTGLANGTGTVSDDGKTMTWTYTYNCPVTKKPTTMRQIEKTTGDKTMTMEMFGLDPKSGKEFKMISYAFTKK